MYRLRVIHRWIGSVVCLFFAMWFASGAVLMYVPFPSLSAEEVRQGLTSPIDSALINKSPGDAVALTGFHTVDRFRIVDRLGEPVYVISPGDGQATSISAANGRTAAVDQREARRIAEKFAGSNAVRADGPLAYDQWVVSDDYDSVRPFYRVWLDDARGTSLYVSLMTGEIAQRTTSRERLWNRFGAVVHWIYPTILRKHPALWDQVVWWLALLGITTVATGGYLGIISLRRSLQSKMKRISPYRSWLRWHHILGVFAGIFVLTWIFSGWLSMDHGRLFSTPQPVESQTSRFRGIELAEAVRQVQIDDLRGLGSFQEAEIFAINGITVLAGRSADSQRLYGIGEGQSVVSGSAELPNTLIRDAVAASWPGTEVSIEYPTESDPYTNLRAGSLPSSTVRAILNDRGRTWIHVDAASGRIISITDRSRRIYRWLYNGLHSFDVPWLVESRPMWDILMLIPLGAGFIFSMTASVLGVRRIRKSLARSKG